MDLHKLMFINEEWGNLKVVIDNGQLNRNNNRKRKSEVLQAYLVKVVHFMTNTIDEMEVSMVSLAVTFFVGRQ